MKNINISEVILALAVIAVLLFVGIGVGYLAGSQGLQTGQISPDTVRAGSNTYTRHVASSTPSMGIDIRTNRAGLEIQNTDATTTMWVFLQSTSTGVSVTGGGIKLLPGQSYTPEFVWIGQVWFINDSGSTSTASIQETTR